MCNKNNVRFKPDTFMSYQGVFTHTAKATLKWALRSGVPFPPRGPSPMSLRRGAV